MDAQNEQPQADQPAELNDFGKVALGFLKYGQQFSNNISESFSDMGLRDWLRLVIIAGAYLLFRQHAMKWLGKRHVENMEKEDAKEKAEISANELRLGKLNVEEYMAEEVSGADWGEKARTRQRLMLMKLMEAEEERKQAEDDDKDLADILED